MKLVMAGPLMVGLTFAFGHATAHAASFKVGCKYSHTAQVDPIVSPGTASAHLHTFFGNTSTDENSNVDPGSPYNLFDHPSLCRNLGVFTRDLSAYWVPSLLVRKPLAPYGSQDPRDFEEVVPSGSPAWEHTFYYLGDARPLAAIQPFPRGLRMIVGDAHATASQDLNVIRWRCVNGSIVDPARPHCIDDPTVSGTPKLRLVINFPNCWDGANIDSADHKSHVYRSLTTSCPATHPVPIPRIQMLVTYPSAGGPDADENGLPGAVKLSSGGQLTMHADFFDAWSDLALEDRITNCIQADLDCKDIAG